MSENETNTENNKKNSDAEYKVGRGNPPKEYQWKPGQSGNPGGRPKGTLKEYVRHKFIEMTQEEKEEFLKKIAPEFQWRMGEGNPEVTQDITSKGEKLELGGASKEIIDKFEEELRKLKT